MLLSTHVMVAASLALAVTPDRPWIAFFLGLASHFLIDAIPHGDSTMYKRYKSGEQVRFAHAYVTIDAIVALLLMATVLNMPFGEVRRGIVTVGMIGGFLPDLLTGLYEWFELSWLHSFHRLHFWFHNFFTKRYGDIPLWAGIGAQTVAIGSMFSLFR